MKIASIVIAAVAVAASLHLGARVFAQDSLYQEPVAHAPPIAAKALGYAHVADASTSQGEQERREGHGT